MDVTQRLTALEGRLQAVEDELAIHKLIVRYGLAVDSGANRQAPRHRNAAGSRMVTYSADSSVTLPRDCRTR